MPHPENLIPRKKGDPPLAGGGRPKGKSMTTILRNVLERSMQTKDPISNKEGKKKIKEIVVLALIQKSIRGDMKAIQEVLDRFDGKVPQGVFGDFAIENKNPFGELSKEEAAEILKKLNEKY